MRLFLLPISTRRTLLYCERLLPPPPGARLTGAKTDTEGQTQTETQTQTQTHARESLVEKVQSRAAHLWSEWERKPAGSWQQRVVLYGNAGLRRISFEEWGLKSVPPLSWQQRRSLAGDAGTDKPDVSATPPVEIVFPPSLIPPNNVMGLLHRLSTEREPLHRRRLLWCFVGMPITAPIAILPVIPNLPFFYLVYRAWSHWRAISGGKHVQYLLQHKKLSLSPSPILDAIYAEEKTKLPVGESGDKTATSDAEKPLLSHPHGGKAVADAYSSLQLELELERAIWQVDTAINREKKRADEEKTAKSESEKQQEKM